MILFQEYKSHIKSVKIHPNFKAKNLKIGTININDIALIQLTKKIDHFGERVNGVCIPKQDQTFDKGTTVRASGYGIANPKSTYPSKNLLQASLCIIDYQTCNKSFGQQIDEKIHICSGNEDKDGPTPCHGDSGGPVTTEEDGRSVQVGIISFTRECGGKTPDVETRISHFVNWIKKTLKDN